MRAPEEQPARSFQMCFHWLLPVVPSAARVAAGAPAWAVGLAEVMALGVRAAPALR